MSPLTKELLRIAGIIVAVIAMVFVLRWRRRTFREHLDKTANEEVCEHLKPALALLLSRGHRIVDVGQHSAEHPLEIHVAPTWDPKGMMEELKLAEPVFLSERNVLYCKEDWCELHPRI
jgi:hypothetical protein